MERLMCLLEFDPELSSGASVAHIEVCVDGCMPQNPYAYGLEPICWFDVNDTLSFRLQEVIIDYSRNDVNMARRLAEEMENKKLPIVLFKGKSNGEG